MDPASWSAYSQHFSRLGASMNHPSGPLSQAQQAQMNDLALSPSLPRQEHIPGYGNTGAPHPFLLAAASHGLNPSQANHNDPSFNANLFAANYDASLFSSSFPSANKGHISSFPQGAAGLFKAVNRENDFNDLRTGFAHCGMSAYARNSDGSNALSGNSGLGSGHLFPNSMPPSSWRHSGIIPPNCGPFGVLPHETVLQRSHLVGRGGDKLSVQGPKQSRTSIPNSSFVEQDLSRGYRSILSSSGRPPSSYVDSSNTSHSSLLSPQSDPYFPSVSDNYYSSCSKNDFAAYSSYCSNMQPSVQRSSISPYCYSQSFGNFESNVEKPDVPTTSTKTSANPNFTNFVPNSSLNGNPAHIHNGQISRQSVITSNVSNNSAMYNSESHPQNHSYNVREPYSYPSGSARSAACLPSHPNESASRSNGSRQPLAHSNNHHSSVGQNLYPPMSTPIPASTPAHTTPPSSTIGQAYVPTPLPLSHDSGCSSVNSQSVMYHSPSNDGCYSTPGTCPSESGSPTKQDLSQHSSPSVYSIDSSNMSINSGPFADSHHVHPHSDVNYGNSNVINGNLSGEAIENVNTSAKMIEENIRNSNSRLMGSNCRPLPTDEHLSSALPIDMVKMNKEYQNARVNDSYDNRRTNSVVQNQSHAKHSNLISPRSECSVNRKSGDFAFSSNTSSSALDFTPKDKCKINRKHKSDMAGNSLPLNCTYSHLQNTQTHLSSPESVIDGEENKNDMSSTSVHSNDSISIEEELPIVTNSPLPVDLSQVSSMDLSAKKTVSPAEKRDSKDDLPDLNYETGKSGGKWSLTKQENSAKKEEEQTDENLRVVVENVAEKDSKIEPALCRTPPLDELSDESKKLCNSIEDLGFLTGLSSDVEDSASKGSFSDKKGKREKGLLQSFLTFLESSNDPPVPSDSVNIESKSDEKEDSKSSPKQEEIEKKDSRCMDDDSKTEEEKNLIEVQDDKDNFDETPSLDPTLFGCSSLQKEMVVPNPEAPSFSSDEDENSTQDIFDSVAMAIQRLCEDNEEDHNEKSKPTNKNNTAKKEMSDICNIAKTENNSEEIKDNNESLADVTAEPCTIKSARVVRRRGKRRKALIVIKVNRNDEKLTTPSKNFKTAMNTKTRGAAKVAQSTQRRVLMRKCKEKDVKNKRAGSKRRKARNCVKRKYVFEEADDSVSTGVKDESPEVQEIDEVIREKVANLTQNSMTDLQTTPPVSTEMQDVVALVNDVNSSESLPEIIEIKQALPMEVQEASVIDFSGPSPAKVKATERLSSEKSPISAAARKKRIQRNPYRTRKRRRKNNKKVTALPVKPVVESEPPKVVETETANTSSSENFETQLKEKSITSAENCLNTETHFKTGDYVISIESKDCSNPPIWRIEGKNVLQLFEALQKEESNSILYRNTSSYSRWSPSSKHKYLLQPVKVIKSDDDTVIVEILKHTDDIVEIDISGSCDYAIHPQKESFEIYLQTLVSHALDVDFIPSIVKDNDEYFLIHYQKIEEITSQKKNYLLNERWSPQLFNSIEMYPYVSVSMSKDDETNLCQVCNNNKIKYIAHFHGPVYDPMTLESKVEGKCHPVCDLNFPLCGGCVQAVTLYSRLHHHNYHFYLMSCKKVKEVQKEDDSAILEECLADTDWISRMFKDMLEMWSASDKYR